MGHDRLHDQHALRRAKAPEPGVGGQVGLAAVTSQAHVGEQVTVVTGQHRLLQHLISRDNLFDFFSLFFLAFFPPFFGC